MYMRRIRPFVSFLLEIVYPRVCAICHDRLHRSELGVCIGCASRLPLYNADLYAAHERLYASPLFRHLYSALTYRKGSPTQTLIHAYKYHGHTELAKLLARMILDLNHIDADDYDLILAIPLEPKKYALRGYNQAMLIAKYLGHSLGLPSSDRHIIRTNLSQTQSSLGKLDRIDNAKLSFVLAPNRAHELRGKRILLVDDILTTGATLLAALDLLEQAEATLVDVCTATVAV